MQESKRALEFLRRAHVIGRRYAHSKSAESECVNDIVELLKWWEETPSEPDAKQWTEKEVELFKANGLVQCPDCQAWMEPETLNRAPCSMHRTNLQSSFPGLQ